MILLSLALVVVSATTLAIGVITTSDALVWASLGSGLGAVALVAGSVSRRRPAAAVPDAAGPAAAGAVAVGSASAGLDPAPSPTPSRPAAPPRTPPGPAPGDRTSSSEAAGPLSPGPAPSPAHPRPGPEVPAAAWGSRDGSPWTAVPAPPPGGSRYGWTGAVPAASPPHPTAPQPAVPVPPPVRPAPVEPEPEAGVEVVPVRDALRVAQLPDEVLVVDGSPRYHLAGCPALAGVEALPLAVSAARRAGFTPDAVCAPDRTLLDRSRTRTAERSNEAP